MNRLVVERLVNEGHIDSREGVGGNYVGRPLMVRRNDYRQELFNGDVGLIVSDPDNQGFSVVFDSPAGLGDSKGPEPTRLVPVVMVPDAIDCFAMTVHKSQGSEFHQVVVMLPRADSAILTRELFYTAITRVCDQIDPADGVRRPGKLCVVGTEEVVRQAVCRRIRRNSGLRDALTGP